MKKTKTITLFLLCFALTEIKAQEGATASIHSVSENNKSFVLEDKCDNIILKNGNEIKGKITEITLNEIKYKKCDNIDGPTVSIDKKDVFMIQYANGTKDIITEDSNKTKNKEQDIKELQKADNMTVGKNIDNDNESMIYFGILGGYGFAAAKSTANSSTYSTTSRTYTDKSYSLGKGINTGIYIGYFFAKHLGAELCTSYLLGSKAQYESTNSNSNSSGGSSTQSSIKGSMIRLIPALKVAIGEKKLQLYIKTGLIIGLGTKVVNEYLSTSSGYSTSVTWEYKGRASLGFNGTLGMNLKLSKSISFFAELATYYQNWAPKKMVITKYISNGVDRLASMTIYEKETDYSSHASNTYDSNGLPVDSSKPFQSGKTYMPFSSVGINIGIQIYLGKKASK